MAFPPAQPSQSAASPATARATRQAGAQSVIAVQSLTKSFKDFWQRTRAKAVDNVTFDVQPGELFGLLGPNGSGKSTCIKIMLGLLKQSSGRVAVFGKPPTDVATKKRIGYLPEESYLYPFLNARETLDYYGKLFSLDYKVRQRRIDELLDMVGLAAVQFRAVKEYSKGMQRRIGLAQALINDPELLILDEPTSGLDPIGTRQVKDLLLQLSRRGKTIILSSHLLADVEDCVDRMVILYGGKIQEEGTCDQLLSSDDRAIIETEHLDDETITQIDALIRARTGKSLIRVSKARQTLEDKFVAIVERASKSNVATSGAAHGGSTAGFLRGSAQDESQRAERLVADLLAESRQPMHVAATAPPPVAAAGPDASLISDLISREAVSATASASPTLSGGRPSSNTEPARPGVPAAPVDLSVIEGLLGNNTPSPDSGKGTGPGKPGSTP